METFINISAKQNTFSDKQKEFVGWITEHVRGLSDANSTFADFPAPALLIN